LNQAAAGRGSAAEMAGSLPLAGWPGSLRSPGWRGLRPRNGRTPDLPRRRRGRPRSGLSRREAAALRAVRRA